MLTPSETKDGKAKPAAGSVANRITFPLEWLFTALAIGLSLWTLATTVNFTRSAWTPIPTLDDWDRWLTYAADHLSWHWLFVQHADHRLILPKVLFETDHVLFHGRSWFLILCTFGLQCLTGVMLWRLSGRSCQQNRSERWILASVITACLFSGQQWFNFVMPFQVQFPMVYCSGMVALYALWKADQYRSQGGAEKKAALWVGAAAIAGMAAAWSMANGVVLWPVVLMAALWLRIPGRWIGAVAAFAALVTVTYFYDWHKGPPPTEFAPMERLQRFAIFLFAHLGSPTAPLTFRLGTENARMAAAAIPGILLAVVLLASFVSLWRRRERYSTARAMLLFYAVFLACSSVSIAYGRSAGELLEAFTPRYLTPGYLFWIAMLLASWPVLRKMQHAILYLALCAAMFVVVTMNQREVAENVKNWRNSIRACEIALVDDVVDPAAWMFVFHDPGMIPGAVDYLRSNRLAVFYDEWTHWPGVPLDRRFSIDRNPDACQGQFEEASWVASKWKPGWRVAGWAWDVKAGRPPAQVVLADENGRVAGVAVTGFPQPPSLSALSQNRLASPWVGYVNASARSVSAYVVESDERSLCPIGAQTLSLTGSEVKFSELGPVLPGGNPTITGAWVKDGYFQGHGGPGAPATGDAVFGSFPDGNTGSIRLGPFQFDGHTEIAIPLVTGPDNRGLSLVVRDAVTKQILAQMDPAPIRVAWWAWHPALPRGRAASVEVLGIDKGSEWGEWMAVGQPHVLKPTQP
jgi:hypothetical protein